jgi:hypothetical protein
MDINVTVSDVTLDTLVREADEYRDGGGSTIADVVADKLVKRITSDGDTWTPLRDKITGIRDGEIRAAVAPLIAEALTKSLTLTNTWGEPTGKTTTLAEVIAAEARKQLTQPVNDSYHSSDKRSIVQKLVADEVRKAFADVVAAEVAKARDLVSAEIGQMVAASVKAGLAKR